MKLGAENNSNMLNLMMIFIYSVLDNKYLFLGKFDSKLFLWGEVWYFDWFIFAEFDDDVQFFCFGSKISF